MVGSAPGQSTAGQSRGAESADELVDVVRAESGARIVRAAHVDLGEHILVTGLPSRVVEVDHRARDVEKGDHFRAVFGYDQGMYLSRRLVDKTALFGYPVVLQIAPPAFDHVADHDHGVTVPVQHARLPYTQEVAPASGHRVEQQWPKPDVLGLRDPDPLVVG